MMDKKNYYSITEVAKLLGISRVAVFKKIKSGKLKAEKIGHFYVIPKTELGGAVGDVLSQKQKNTIEAGVKRTVKEYREVLEKLGQE